MRDYFVEKKEIVKEIKNKRIAIYADNLSKEDSLLVQKFMKNVVKQYDINSTIKKTGKTNILHNHLPFYAPAPVKEELCLIMEFMNILACDEIWIFDNGYHNYERGGRLDERLRDLEKPVKFLYKTDDSWDFYQGRETYYNESDELEDDYYLIVDEISCENKSVEPVKTLRNISHEELSEKEYELTKTAFLLIKYAEQVALRAMVRQDTTLLQKVKAFIKSGNEVFFGILSVTSCDDVMLRNYDAKNDFTQAGLDELCEQYAVC